MTKVTFATFNVRNLVNAEQLYYKGKKYTKNAFERKIKWLANQLVDMDADVVCLQEVFHQQALNILASAYNDLVDEQKKYTTVWHADNALSTTDDPSPGLGLLSRLPVIETEVVQDISSDPIKIEPELGLEFSQSMVSRPIMIAKVELHENTHAWVFNAHLKSKRPIYPDDAPEDDEMAQMFYARALGTMRSLMRRAGDAIALRRELIKKMKNSTIPVVAIGDLNDGLGAVTTDIVAGEAPYRNWCDELKAKYWEVQLYSAIRAHMRRAEKSDLFTYIYNGSYSTIDHIFVSQEFYFRNKNRIGNIDYVRSYNDHIGDSTLGVSSTNYAASDHGQLVMQISLADRQARKKPCKNSVDL